MANYQNHLVDPTYFFDCIEEFAFDYDLFVVVEQNIDDYGKQVNQYQLQTIRGSLQTDGLRVNQSKKGNIAANSYNFYCKSLYRINIGDIIKYKDNYLQVNSVHEYDEWGVRECSLSMIQLAAYRDLANYIDYLKGEKII